MKREKEFEKVKRIIKKYYSKANHGLYNTRNLVGDEMTTIFGGEYFTIDICYFYSYFEVFGTTYDEFEELKELYHELREKEVN